MTIFDDAYISRVSRAYIFFTFFPISSYRTAFLSNTRQIANRWFIGIAGPLERSGSHRR